MGKYKELTDLELFKKVSQYDSRALEEVYNRYSVLLYTLIKKIAPDEEIAKELLIEVFAIIWRKIDRFEFRKGNPYTWLVTLARNRAVDSLRRSRNAGNTLESYTDEYENFFIVPYLPSDIDTLDIETSNAVKPKIEDALEKLSDAQKYVIHLAFYEGYFLNDIAGKLNIPIETVRGKVMAALHSLRDNLVSDEPYNIDIDPPIHEIISAYSAGCIDVKNLMQFMEFIREGGSLPPKELGELQNIMALIPVILEPETPDPELKDKVAKRLISMHEEMKDKIKAVKEQTKVTKVEKDKTVAAAPAAATPEPPKTKRMTVENEPAAEKRDTIREEEPSQPREPKEQPPRQPRVEQPERKGGRKGKLYTEGPTPIYNERDNSGGSNTFFWIVVILILVVSCVIGYFMYSANQSLEEEVRALEEKVTDLQQQLRINTDFVSQYNSLIEFFNYKDISVVDLDPGEASPESSGKLYISFAQREGLIEFTNMPELKTSEGYQLWMVSKGKSFSLGTYVPIPGRRYHEIDDIPYVPKEDVDLFRITNEPREGAEVPSGETYLFGNFEGGNNRRR